jgi:heme A synthase
MEGDAMTAGTRNTRRLSIAALVVACLHLVFGAIVRISGSGMGCGDHWPKCYGYWFPPLSRPDLIVEVSHRYLASILTLAVLSMAFVAWRNRDVAGIGGKGGALRSALGAVGAVFTAAILGGVTVKMGNAPWATVAHWLVAMTLLAMVATTAMRTGALGGASAMAQRGTSRAKRSAFAAAALAIFAVALGGLTAKYPGAAVGCTTVPMCGANPAVEAAGVYVQITHRTLAVLLVLHLIGVVMMVRSRRESEAPVVVRAAHVALGMVLLQLLVASAMVLMHLPPVLRSLHEATGVGIWLSCFVLAYLARRASRHPDTERSEVEGPLGIAGRASSASRGLSPAAQDESALLAAEPETVAEIAPPVELDWEPRRAAHVEEIDAAVAGWIAERSRDDVLAAFEAAEAAIAPIYDARDLLADPQLAAIDAFVSIEDEELGSITMTNMISRLSETPGGIERTGAAHGADTAEVLAEVGVDDAELERLRTAGVV